MTDTGIYPDRSNVAGLPAATVNSVQALTRDRPVRDDAIDVFRFIMAMLVILLHLLPSDPTSPWGMKLWVVYIDAACRSAVPFFFITSGYYFRENRRAWENSKRAVMSLVPIYVFWWVVYFVVSCFVPGMWPTTWRFILLLDGGAGPHLWFLPALAFGIVTLAVTLHVGGRHLAAAVAIGLALIGPILFNYHAALGVERYPHHLSDLGRQLAAPAFIFIGFVLQKTRPINLMTSSLLLTLLFIFLLAERYFLVFGISARAGRDAEGLVATFAYGTATFILARSLNGHA